MEVETIMEIEVMARKIIACEALELLYEERK